MHRTACIAALLVFLSAVAAGAAPSPEGVARKEVEGQEHFWKSIASDPVEEQYTSRELFHYALALCEADMHLGRLDRLFELGAWMQQRDPDEPGYGNFYWYSDRPEVKDRNAVEFCMEPATILWIRHRDKLDDAARDSLREIMNYAVEGCLDHRVGSTYTNIALMNAGNLIRLGEALDRPEVAQTGYQRLENFGWYTLQCGIHEYVSSTYYAVDMTTLQLIARFSERKSARRQARALLELLWTDVTASWYGPAGRLAGPNSRTYDFLYNEGGVERLIRMRGWLDAGSGGPRSLLASYGRWSPDEETLSARSRYPRLVQASWGRAARETRTHMVHEDVTLGSAGAQYHAMDVPLTVDLPGSPRRVRGYFRPDGRDDPFGMKRYDIGSGHMKARHLRPFWTAAQRRNDAVGVCIYRLRGRKREELETLKSHFVLPADVDGMWLGDRRVRPRSEGVISSRRLTLDSGQALVLRQGTAAVGVRVPVARREDGNRAPIRFIDNSSSVEAESGTASGSFRVKSDPAAGGDRYVDSGDGDGRLSIRLKVREAGTYPVWGRTLAPNGKSNSFFVRIRHDGETVLQRATWHVDRSSSWRWTRMKLGDEGGQSSLELPAGTVTLELLGREGGTRIDSLRFGGPPAVRLTVDHTAEERTEPGAVGLWVRIGSGLESDEEFREWRRAFRRAEPDKKVSNSRLSLSAPGDDGPVGVDVRQPWKQSARVKLTPPPSNPVLGINGTDVGREILQSVPPFSKRPDAGTMPEPFEVEPEAGTAIEAEDGAVLVPFRVEKDEDASGGRCVTAASAGAIRIPLQVPREDDYYLWGRVLAPSGTTDSFYVRVKKGQRTLVPRHAWHTGRGKTWRWSRVELRDREPPRRIHLPRGEVTLELLPRESGTGIDALWITSSPDATPPAP